MQFNVYMGGTSAEAGVVNCHHLFEVRFNFLTVKSAIIVCRHSPGYPRVLVAVHTPELTKYDSWAMPTRKNNNVGLQRST
jgi:hypothetical protein